MATKSFCDVCHREIEKEKLENIRVYNKPKPNNEPTSYKTYDLCSICYKRTKDTLTPLDKVEVKKKITEPYLMPNCEHRSIKGEGWCMGCIEKLDNEKSKRIDALYDSLNKILSIFKIDTTTSKDITDEALEIVDKYKDLNISEMTDIVYVTQEAAMAPGIVKDWPKVIPHPTDSNGRLVQKKLWTLKEK